MRRRAAGAVTAVLLTLAACADDDDPAEPIRTASNGDEFNDADVAFATAMIPHHAQALLMVDMTRGRPLDPAFRRLTEDIRAAQAPEIELMVDWLTAWDEPVPPTMRDHANAHDPDAMGAHDLDGLDTSTDAAFEDLWLTMMIEHHEGAIEMARDEQADGHFEPAVELAESIEAAQTDEIELMEQLLDR